ncbi:unnamed protein product, partial [Mesorhabditis belari]|uniref:Battenin n=1 Tax=Mesorhabditis belari TaxID=2138241 RepID=A0AAF3ET26_9BILA
MKATTSKKWRTYLAFWLFGICNNITYSMMLGAAEDIISRSGGGGGKKDDGNSTCPSKSESRKCDGHQSTGIVLLVDILPSLVIQLIAPMLIADRLSFTVRMLMVVSFQAVSLFIVAMAGNFGLSILGVAMTSMSSGLGESTLVSLSSHFPKPTVVAWASGTGVAGILGSFLYAALTEPHLVNLKPETVLLMSLVIPILYAITFWLILDYPTNLLRIFRSRKIKTMDIVEGEKSNSQEKLTVQEQRKTTIKEKFLLIKPLLHYMIPLTLVYVGEYVINQGFTQFLLFDCRHGFNLSKESQYRWYQVLYSVGVFISRSSSPIANLPRIIVYILPVLQLANAIFFYFEALHAYLPHISIAFALIFYEGLLGGSSYVKTINDVHKMAAPDVREFSLAVVMTSDSTGILIASLLAILLHNQICDQLGT